MKKFVSIVVAMLLLITSVAVFPAYAEEAGHVIINQVYGASDDGYADHSFIELYNPTNAAVNLNGWSVQYRSSKEGPQTDNWSVLELTGAIGGDYYLIRCGAVKTPSGSYQVPQGNREWDMVLYNKGLSVVLLSTTEALTDAFIGDITADGFVLPQGFVDLAAVQGNDATDEQIPPAYEKAYAAIQSKKRLFAVLTLSIPITTPKISRKSITASPCLPIKGLTRVARQSSRTRHILR